MSQKPKPKPGKPRTSAKSATKSSFQKLWPGKILFFKILIGLNIVLSCALLLTYTSSFISPEKFTLPAFMGLAFPFLAVINLGFIMFWLTLFRPYFFISSIALVLGLGHISSHFQLHKQVELSSANVVAKVMSYNVRMFDLFQWNKNEESVHGILKSFSDHAPDILCLQEFYQPQKGNLDILRKIKKIHHLDHVHVKYWREVKSGGYGIVTFSAFPIIHKEEIQLSKSPDMFALITDVETKGDTIRVINVHLSSYHFAKDDYEFVVGVKDKPDTKMITTGSLKVLKKMHRGFKERARQAELIREEIDASPYPVVVCGDFNDSPSGYAYKKVKGDLRDAFIESGSGFGRSYTGIFPSYRIDYILHDSRYESINFREYSYPGSDHIPVACYLIHPKKEI